MKNIKILFIIFTATLFFTACEKDETPETFDTISGQITAGENVSADDLKNISIYLGKLQDGIDPATVTTETEGIDLVEELQISAEGTFTFNNLLNGNYVLALDEGFNFAQGEFIIVNIDGISDPNLIKQNVERVELENDIDDDQLSFMESIFRETPTPRNYHEFNINCAVVNNSSFKDEDLNFYIKVDGDDFCPINMNTNETYSFCTFIAMELDFKDFWGWQSSRSYFAKIKDINGSYSQENQNFSVVKYKFPKWRGVLIRFDYNEVDGVATITVSD